MSTSSCIELNNEIAEITRGVDWLEEFGRTHNIPGKIIIDFAMAFDEIVTNIISYGYDDKNEHRISIELDIEDGYLKTVFRDNGRQFNPLSIPEPDTAKSLEEREIGGLGIYLVKRLMDDVAYDYRGGYNIFTMKKKID